MYDIHMHLDSFDTTISDGLKYIATTFNTSTWKLIYIVCVYKFYSCLIFIFLKNLQTIIKNYLKHCLIVILGDFIDNIPKDNNNVKKRLNLGKKSNSNQNLVEVPQNLNLK